MSDVDERLDPDPPRHGAPLDRLTRRRLVCAVGSVTTTQPARAVPPGGRAGGAAGTRRGEAARWPSLVGGVLLTATLVGGVPLIGGLTAPATPSLADGDLVVARSSGARYLDLGGVLHPVLNVASARLLTRTAPRTVVVEDRVVDASPHGAVLGIPGAPDDLPAPDRLLVGGWVACSDDGRIRLTLGGGATTPEAAAGVAPTPVVVEASGRSPGRYLLVGARRLALPPVSAGALGAAWGSTSAVVVAPGLLDLFAPGTPLDATSLALGPGLGAGLPAALRRPGVERVGQLVDTDGGAAVVLADGLAPLDPFAAAVYAATAPAALGRRVPLAPGDLGAVPLSEHRDPAPVDWPRRPPDGRPGTPCARLDADAGGRTRTTLVLRPASRPAGPAGPAGPTAAPVTSSPQRTASTPPPADVPPGAGALVRVGPSRDGAPVLLVDGSGVAYPVAEPTTETLTRLGYGALPVSGLPAVPTEWAALLPRGPTLSEAAARAGPP